MHSIERFSFYLFSSPGLAGTDSSLAGSRIHTKNRGPQFLCESAIRLSCFSLLKARNYPPSAGQTETEEAQQHASSERPSAPP